MNDLATSMELDIVQVEESKYEVDVQVQEAMQSIQMLGSNDVAARIAAANRLNVLASVLGEDRTREILIPILSSIMDDDDEVLLAVAKELGSFVNRIGGPEYAEILLPTFEILLTVKEGSVRDAASMSMKMVASQLPKRVFQDQYATMIASLATKEWFNARASAACLIPSAYTSLTNAQQIEHLKHFEALCQDVTPMVLRVAAQQLGPMLVAVTKDVTEKSLDEKGVITRVLLPLCETLASQKLPDSVRLYTPENCVAFAKILAIDSSSSSEIAHAEMDVVKRIVALFISSSDDRSWRVRWCAAAKIAEFISCLEGLPDAIDLCITSYEKLLHDPENEVRTVSVYNLPVVAKCQSSIPPSSDLRDVDYSTNNKVAFRLLSRLSIINDDESEHVRAALATTIVDFASIFGKDITISHLLPVVLLLIRDPSSEVRLNVMATLGDLSQIIGADLLCQSLLPAIMDLAQDGKWRVRLSIASYIPTLAEQLGIDYFTSRFLPLYIAWLGDDIAAIRVNAAQNTQNLVALFGTAWAIEFILPTIQELRHHESYSRRVIAIQACTYMVQEMKGEVVLNIILPLVLEMATDKVPNVRFNVAKSIERIAAVCGSKVCESQFRPVLDSFSRDSDRDVRYFARKAMELLNLNTPQDMQY